MKQFFLIIFLIACISTQAKHIYFDKDTVSFSESDEILDSSFGRLAGVKANVKTFHSVNYIAHLDYLFKISILLKNYENIEGSRCKLSVTALKKSGDIKYFKVWSIRNHDCSGRVDPTGSFFTTTEHGCCGAENVISYFSIENGKLIVTGTSSANRIPNTDLMIIYMGKNGCSFNNPDKNIEGIIYLISKNKIVDKLDVKSLSGPPWTPRIKTDNEQYYHKENKLITFEFDEENYNLFVKGNSFLIPKGSQHVFSK